MGARGRFRRLLRALAPMLLAVAAACAKDAPQDALAPEGPIAREQHNLFMVTFWVAAVIFFLVEGLIVLAAIKFRDRGGRRDPSQIHGNSRLEIGWTIAPALLLLGIAIPTVLTIFSQAQEPRDALRVTVVGRQWWWEYRYDTDPAVVTANELVIPTGRPVRLDLESADVIHSFWVPKLAGKQDVVPGRSNPLTLLADKPGEYLGQCAEFCSISHANMRLKVIAKTPAEFDRWVREQAAPPADPASADAIRGKDLFFANACINCHAIGDQGAAVGPNLTHLAARTTFGSVMFPMDEGTLIEWVRHARDLKPGVLMPNFDRPVGDDGPPVPGHRVLADEEIRLIVAYLLSLR